MAGQGLNEQIKTLIAQRTVKLDAFETLVTTAESEVREFTEAEQNNFEDFKQDLGDLDKRINRLQETEQLLAASRAKPIIPENRSRQPITQNDREIDKPSYHFAKIAHALYVNQGNRVAAGDYAAHMWGDETFANCLRMPQFVTHASVDPAQSDVVGWAKELVKVDQANQAFIDILRPMSVVARFPGMQMGFPAGTGSIKIPRKSAKSSGTWVGEFSPIKVDRLTFDSITLDPKKNANIVTSTREMLIRSDPSALMILRDDILTGVAESIDGKFVSADAAVAGVSPAGLQTFDSSPTATSGATLDNITTDLKNLVGALLAINMPMTRPVWLINPLNVNALRFIRDGLGQYAYKAEIAAGTIVGYPYLESTTVPVDVVMLTDSSQVIIASELAPEIALSEDATLHMEDTTPSGDLGGSTSPVVSMFQVNAVAIRALTTQDWGARHDDCVQVLTGVAWNA